MCSEWTLSGLRVDSECAQGVLKVCSDCASQFHQPTCFQVKRGTCISSMLLLVALSCIIDHVEKVLSKYQNKWVSGCNGFKMPAGLLTHSCFELFWPFHPTRCLGDFQLTGAKECTLELHL